MFLWDDRKTRWSPWPLFGLDISDFSSETTEQNSTKLDRKSSTSSTKVVFFGPIEKTKCTLPTLWLAETFTTFPLKRFYGIQGNLTEIKISTFSTIFLGQLEKQDSCPSLSLAEIFSSSSLKPLNGISQNLIGSKISPTEFVFFRPIGKTRWSPWSICQKGGTLYLGTRYVALWASWLILLLVHITNLSVYCLSNNCHCWISACSYIGPQQKHFYFISFLVLWTWSWSWMILYSWNTSVVNFIAQLTILGCLYIAKQHLRPLFPGSACSTVR